MSDDNDNDKVIDITSYVKDSKSEDELELDEFTNRFVNMYNQGIIDRQKRLVRERFIYFMIHVLMFTQLLVIIAVCLMYIKFQGLN